MKLEKIKGELGHHLAFPVKNLMEAFQRTRVVKENRQNLMNN
jgi:hypothetical protein